MSTSQEYRDQATEQRRLRAVTRSLTDGCQHRKRAEAHESLAATEDWLNEAVPPTESRQCQYAFSIFSSVSIVFLNNGRMNY